MVEDVYFNFLQGFGEHKQYVSKYMSTIFSVGVSSESSALGHTTKETPKLRIDNRQPPENSRATDLLVRDRGNIFEN